MAEEEKEEEQEDLKPPTQGTVIDPVLRCDSTDSLSKKERRKLEREELERDWTNFPNLPGTHLSMRKTWRRSHSLPGPDGKACASLSESWCWRVSYHSDGRTYQWRRARDARSEGKLVKDLLDVTERMFRSFA